MTTGTTGRWRRHAARIAGGAALAVAFGVGLRAVGAEADAPPTGDATAKRAVAPIAPALPGELVLALQEGKFAEGIAALDAHLAAGKTPAADRPYLQLVRGVALRLAGRPDEARVGLQGAIDAAPQGPWANKLRGELAALELATGHADRAEALARAEAESLLNPDRKDRLAGTYRDFARRLLEPEFPGAKPDPIAAHALLAKGRDLAKGDTLRARLLFEMAKAAQLAAAADQPAPNPQPTPRGRVAPPSRPDAAADFAAYIKDYPNGADRDEARFRLGEAQFAAGRVVDARTTWADLARDLAARPGIADDKARQEFRAWALYNIARTYGIPSPADATSLNLGVAALRRVGAETPANFRAVRAAFEVGESYLNRGQADPAIAAFEAFLRGEGYRVESDAARRDRAEFATRATFQVARAKLGQGRFEEAVAAFEGYLSQYPSGPESGDARRSILDARFAAAEDAFGREKFADARAGWTAFADAYPLDGRVPTALFNVGRAFAAENKYPEAIAAWDALAARFPDNAEAAHGRFEAAALVEVEQGDPAAAIERFRKVAGDNPWVAQAAQRIAVMEAKALAVVTPRAFRSGESPQLKVTTRNLETLTFSAYKLDPEAYFRKKQTLGDVGALDVGLVAPDAEWTAPVPGYAKYKPVEATFDLKVAVPGVYVVKVSDEKHLQAAALVIGSDLEAIVKASRTQLLVFAQDMKAGKGRAGAKVLVADGTKIVFEGTTGPDGVVQGTWNPEAAPPVSPRLVPPQAPGSPTPPVPPSRPSPALAAVALPRPGRGQRGRVRAGRPG